MGADFPARSFLDFSCLVSSLDDMASRVNLSLFDTALWRIVCDRQPNVQVVRAVRGCLLHA